MKKPKIIVDPGSCHYCDKGLSKDLIASAAESGADAIKFQMFKNKFPNIPLPYNWLPELVEYGNKKGIEVFASVWDQQAVDVLKECKCKSIKFACSQNGSTLIKKTLREDFENIYISYDDLSFLPYDYRIKRLYCVPKYPNFFTVNFDGMFSIDRYQGISDHSLGIIQTIAAFVAGADVIEKHFHLGKDHARACPDSLIAISPDELKKLAEQMQKCCGLYKPVIKKNHNPKEIKKIGTAVESFENDIPGSTILSIETKDHSKDVRPYLRSRKGRVYENFRLGK